ncbi:MAG: hypothetical protein DRQ64_08125, partial [Gammaproteobacteria bacterium]
QTGPNVSLGQVTQANTAGLQAGLGAIEGIDNFRKIKNKNTIMDLLKNSDSANFGKNAGQIMSLAADTTEGGAKAATQGLTAFQNKANSDLTGLGKILTANKAASNSKATGSYLTALNKYEVLKNNKPSPDQFKDDMSFSKALTKWENDIGASKVNALRRQGLVGGGNTGNQGMIDETSRTMNKYFDRKIDFGKRTPQQTTGTAVDPRVEELLRLLKQKNQPSETSTDGDTPVIDKIKKNTPLPNEEGVFNPETGIMGAIKNSLKANPAAALKPKINPYVRPAPAGAKKIPAKTGARAPAVKNGPNWVKGNNIDEVMQTTKGFKDEVAKSSKNIVAGNRGTIIDKIKGVIKNPTKIGKFLNPGVAGGLLMSTDAGQTNEQQAAAIENGPIGTAGTQQAQMVNGKLVYPGDKGYVAKTAVENIQESGNASGSVTTTNDSTGAIEVGFNEEKAAKSQAINAAEVNKLTRQNKNLFHVKTKAVGKQKLQIENQIQANNIKIKKLNEAPGATTNKTLSSINKNAPTTENIMSKNSGEYMKQAIPDQGQRSMVQNTMSTRSQKVLSNILNFKENQIKNNNGKYAVTLGDKGAVGGQPLYLTGNSRAELAQNFMYLMTQLSQNRNQVDAYIEGRPEDERIVLRDLMKINASNNSDPSNPFARFFRNDEVRGTNSFVPAMSDSSMISDTITEIQQ